MAKKGSGEVPIFSLGIRPTGKKEHIAAQLEKERTSSVGEAKGQLVAAQVLLHKEGRYDDVAKRLRTCHTFEDYHAAFEEWPDIQYWLTQISAHKLWIWKDTTWSWATQFYYGQPPAMINTQIPLRLANYHDSYSYHCELCSKGGFTTMDQHCKTRLHIEHEYRYACLYGSTPLPACNPTFSDPVGKYLLDIDKKTESPISTEPIKKILPEGFSQLYRPTHHVGYVVMVLNLSSGAKSVKVASTTLKVGPKLQEAGKKKFAIDFFSVLEANKRRANCPVQTWRTLMFPVAQSAWVEVRVDGNVIHHEQLHPPETSMVVEYIINDKKGYYASTSSNSNASSWNRNDWKSQTTNWKTCQTSRRPPVPLRQFLEKSYLHVKSGRVWPVQFLGEDDFLISAVIYITEPDSRNSPRKWVDYDKPEKWNKSGSWSKNNWSNSTSRWSDWNSWNNAEKESSKGEKESTGKDIIMYLHGDQYRELAQCSMPGLADFLWPTPDAGPIKFAHEKGELQGKVLLHPCCPCDSYWFRHPNVHDAGFFNAQVASALANIRTTASEYWGGNSSRFFVTGLSMGGYGALELAALWGPKIVAGALIACPSHDAIRQEYFARRLHEIPLWIFHGRRDHLCKWEETSSLILRMVDMGPRDLRYSSTGCKDFDSHTDTGYCLENKDAYEWLEKR